MYIKKHASIDTSMVNCEPSKSLCWQSETYQVNGQKAKQFDGPAELKAIELTKLSYPQDGQIAQNLQGIHTNREMVIRGKKLPLI